MTTKKTPKKKVKKKSKKRASKYEKPLKVDMPFEELVKKMFD